MADWETTLFCKLLKVPEVYFRYLDDIFGVWSHGIQAFNHFISLSNNHHPTIKLTAQTHFETINFLDTTVFFAPDREDGDKQLLTKVYFTPTDTHCLLHKHSFHPRHTFEGLIKSQLIRFHRICSLDEHVEEATCILFKALCSRGYSKRFLRYIKSRTRQQIHDAMSAVRPDAKKSHPTHSDGAKQLNRRLKINFQTAQISNPVFRHFRIVSAYRKNRNLRDILVRAALHPDPGGTRPETTPHFVPRKVLWVRSREHITIPHHTRYKEFGLHNHLHSLQ